MVDAVFADALVLLTTIGIVKVLVNLAHLDAVGVATANVDRYSIVGSVATNKSVLRDGVTAVARHPPVGVLTSGSSKHLYLSIIEHHLPTAVADAAVQSLVELARQQVDVLVTADVERRLRGFVAGDQGTGGHLLSSGQLFPLQRAC